MSRLNLDVKDSVYAEFQSHCEEDGRRVSDVVRQLVVEFNAKKRKERVLRKQLSPIALDEALEEESSEENETDG